MLPQSNLISLNILFLAVFYNQFIEVILKSPKSVSHIIIVDNCVDDFLN